MNIFSSIFKAFKDGATEMGEPVVDTNDIHSFEQSIAKASLQLSQAKQSQKEVQAKLAQNEALVKTSQISIGQKETQAIAASEAGDEAKALSIAGSIITENEQLSSQKELSNYLHDSLTKIDRQIASLTREISEMKAQLSQVKATDAVHKVQSDLSSQYTQLPSAKESLAKLKAQQAETQASIEVAKEVNDFLQDSDSLQSTSLDEKLAQAAKRNAEMPDSQQENQAAHQMLNKLKSQQKDD